MEIEFKINGKVKAKQSVKFTSNGIKYIPSDIKEYANWVRLCFINKYPKWNIQNFANKPLKSQIDVFMTIPKSFSKKKSEQAVKGNIRPTVKPDCDNIAKNINDALNGIVYLDDKQIVSLVVNKFYSDNEFVRVKIAGE